MKQAWRHVVLAGLAAGLALAPLLSLLVADARLALAAAGAGAILAWAARPGDGARRAAVAGWIAALSLVAALAGLACGSIRIAAIDSGALLAAPGTEVELEGTLAAAPRFDGESLAAQLETRAGRVQARGPDLDGIAAGAEVRVRGRVAELDPFRAAPARRRGVALALEAERVEPTGEARGGLAGRFDAIRERAERSLERGMPERESALARGFVLGQDDRIPEEVRHEFRRSGLAHLLAVSGQNVLLLCLLAWPLLAVLGLTLRARLVVLLALIAVYVPVTGAGPSIQRAAVMGAAGLVAALADRPASRWYAVLLAAALTLAVNPRSAGDVGWQLSFAAVIGILCWSPRLASLLAAGGPAGSVRRAIAEGGAMTLAATIATAPLTTHHFGTLSLAAVPANLLALPAVAPAMWLGMLAGIAGQAPWIPVEPLNWLNSLFLGYIGQIAAWSSAPPAAQVEVTLGGAAVLLASYLLLAGLVEAGLAAAARRRGLAAGAIERTRRPVRVAAAGLAAAALVVTTRASESPLPPDALIVRVLDVGQGDSILLDPPGADPVLVDAGPPGGGAADRLGELGVESLAALVVTHDQSDHAGGAPELLRSTRVRRLLYAGRSPELAALAEIEGAEVLRPAEGTELRDGELRVTVLWPPRPRLALAAEDPNASSLVLLAEWRHFSILLTGDAEAELVPLDPGPIDVLKVAHHGSADGGLAALLAGTAPKLAAISVGENSHGHPAPETLAELGEHGVPVLRTDEEGEIVVEVGEGGWSVR